MKHLIIKENEDVRIVENPSDTTLTHAEANELEVYIEQKKLKNKFIHWTNHSIRFINYVGFIECSSFSLEILPKLQLSNDHETSRRTLLLMLNELHSFHINKTTLTKLSVSEFSLMHIFASIYAKELLYEFKRGILSQYRTNQENIYHLKGKLHIQQHIKQNMVRKRPNLLYCEFNEHSHNNMVNQLFLSTNLLLLKHIKSRNIRFQLQQLNHQLYDVDHIPITNEQMQGIIIDRTMQRYKTSIHLAMLFQQKITGSLTTGKNQAFSLLFEMQELYEQYIATLIQRYIPIQMSIQDNSHALFTRNNQPVGRLFPDIVIHHPNDEKIIIDTKWKGYNNRYGIHHEDLVQMYTYLMTYKNCQKAFVLFPEATTNQTFSDNVWEIAHHTNKKVIAKTIPLVHKQDTISRLEEMIYSD